MIGLGFRAPWEGYYQSEFSREATVPQSRNHNRIHYNRNERHRQNRKP